MLTQQEPLLSFEFSSSNGEIKPLTFRHPHKLIIAHSIEEVITMLSTHTRSHF